MSTRTVRSPRCIIIAGPNGAGKTTFAREFLLRETGVIHFVNADLIAGGLSPLRPELAARQAGRLVLTELIRLAKAREDFAFESTLSGRTYLRTLTGWKTAGYWTSQAFADTSVSPIRHGFKGLRTDPAQMAVATGAIIEHVDVIRYLGLGDLTSRVDTLLDPFLLQAAKKGFGYGVIPAIATSAHAGLQVMGMAETPPRIAAKL